MLTGNIGLTWVKGESCAFLLAFNSAFLKSEKGSLDYFIYGWAEHFQTYSKDVKMTSFDVFLAPLFLILNTFTRTFSTLAHYRSMLLLYSPENKNLKQKTKGFFIYLGIKLFLANIYILYPLETPEN